MFSIELFYSIVDFPAIKKREIIEKIGGEYKEGINNEFDNAEIIYNWLTENNFRGEPTLENIEEYIEEFFHPKPQYEEFYEERLPEIDESEELKQLEAIRDEINKRIEELTVVVRLLGTVK